MPAALDQLTPASPLTAQECPGLLTCLAAVSDPRDRRGRMHPLVGVLAICAAAVLTGATSLPGRSASGRPTLRSRFLARLGARRDPFTGRHQAPCETTIRRVLTKVDGDVLDRAVGSWLSARRPQADGRMLRAIAVDGKSLRGAPRAHDRKIHLLAAVDHADLRRPGAG